MLSDKNVFYKLQTSNSRRKRIMIVILRSAIDDVVVILIQTGGVATVCLTDVLLKSNKQVFGIASEVLDIASSSSSSPSSSLATTTAICQNNNDQYRNEEEMINAIPQIEPNSSSAIVTGYHSAGDIDSLNRYNTCQGGFFFRMEILLIFYCLI